MEANEKPPHDRPTTTNEKDLESTANPQSSAGDNGAPAYELHGLPLYLVILGLGIAIFLMSLDYSIIATAIPRITSQFNSTGDIAWYGSAYSFSMCALQPISGKIFSSFALKVRAIPISIIVIFGHRRLTKHTANLSDLSRHL